MTGPVGRGHDDRDVDAEFARMLEGEGLVLGPGEAPREPAAAEPPEDEGPWPEDDDAPGPPSPEAIARSRAAHPSAARPPGPGREGRDGPRPPRELDDEDVLYGEFEPPDPDLPTPSDRAMWSWTALLGGFALLLAGALTPAMPAVLGWLGGLAAVGGLVALLLRAPRGDGDDEDPHGGAEV